MYDQYLVVNKIASRAYDTLTYNEGILQQKVVLWEKELNVDMDLQQLVTCIKEIYKTTNVTKYRSFQYRLLVRAIVTNIQLCRWKIRGDDLCSFCHKHQESYVHLFVMCKEVKSLWLRFEQWFTKFSNDTIHFAVDTVIANKLVDDPTHLFNFLCLLMKQYIYRKRCMSQALSFKEYVNHVNTISNVKKFIATKNNHLSKHNKKWFLANHNTVYDNENEYVMEYLQQITYNL